MGFDNCERHATGPTSIIHSPRDKLPHLISLRLLYSRPTKLFLAFEFTYLFQAANRPETRAEELRKKYNKIRMRIKRMNENTQ